MARLLYATSRSPFARKVRIALLEKQLPFELSEVDLAQRSAAFVAASPLGKVPMLIDDDATRVFDSTVICEYLEDRYPEPSLLGPDYATRLRHRVLDELGDTIAEQAIKLFYSEREGAIALDKARRLLTQALDELTGRIAASAVPDEFGLGHAAVISGIGYMTLRLGDAELAARPGLATWIRTWQARPSVERTAPPPP